MTQCSPIAREVSVRVNGTYLNGCDAALHVGHLHGVGDRVVHMVCNHIATCAHELTNKVRTVTRYLLVIESFGLQMHSLI